MAAAYYVRIKGKEHGPFSGAQLKSLADKGQVTEAAEVRQGEDGPWFPATKVKGLFTDAPKKQATGSSSSGSKPSRPSKKPKKKPVKKKRTNVVAADDVFDLGGDDSDDDVEFLDDDEDDLFDDEDDFDDDFEDDDYDERPARRKKKAKSRGRKRSGGGSSWGTVRVGLLLIAIGLCIQMGSFACQALVELIAWPTMASGGFAGGQSLASLMQVLGQGVVFLGAIASVLCIVGCAMSIVAPGAAMGLAIAATVLYAVHTVMHFMYVLGPLLEARSGMGFGMMGRGAMGSWGSDGLTTFILVWFTLFAALILTSLLLWAIADIKKDHHHANSCMGNVWLIGIFAGIYVLAYVMSHVRINVTSLAMDRLMMWMFVLLRFGHLTLYGIYLGRLMPQTFYSKDTV